MHETEALADFLADLTYEDLPADVVETAKLSILDTIGAGVAASGLPWSRTVTEVASTEGARGNSTVWGTTSPQLAATAAAMANGTASHGIEMDDRVPSIPLHPGAMVVPPAFAVIEADGGSGRDLIVAVTAGYELGIRVGRAVRPREGIHPPGHLGIWGAVAAAGTSMGLAPLRMRDAFGLAASMASGVWEFSQDPRGTMVKRLHAGKAAYNGVLAALLAKRGFTGPVAALEGSFGYGRTFGDAFDATKLTEGLGGRFRILEREVKPYAAWGGSHVAIDAVDHIRQQHGVQAQQVRKLSVGGSTYLLNKHGHSAPESIMAAQYSLPFLVALTLVRGSAVLMNPNSIWSDETVADKEVRELAATVELFVDDEMERIHQTEGHYGGARVTIELDTNEILERTVYNAKGSAMRPMEPSEIRDKFLLLCSDVLGAGRAMRAARAAADLESVDDLRTLGQQLSTGRL